MDFFFSKPKRSAKNYSACLLGAYERPVLVYMLLVYLNIGFLIAVFTAGMVQRKPQ